MASYGTTEVAISPMGAMLPSLEVEVVEEDLVKEGGPSFAVMGFLVLLGDSPRGLMFPTLWPLVSSFGGTKAAQGIVSVVLATQ